MIISFANYGSKDIYLGKNTKRARKICPKELHQSARRKLVILDQAEALQDLRLPGNDLKKVQDRYQVRINRQYRIRFEWNEGDAQRVEVGEFHE